MMKMKKGIHFKMPNEDHKTIVSFFKRNQHLNMSGLLRDLILDYIKEAEAKREGK